MLKMILKLKTLHNLRQIYAPTTNCAIHQKHQSKGTLADNYITYMNSVEMKQEFYFNRPFLKLWAQLPGL